MDSTTGDKKLDIEMQNDCAELKIRAERKAGEFLQEVKVASCNQQHVDSLPSHFF